MKDRTTNHLDNAIRLINQKSNDHFENKVVLISEKYLLDQEPEQLRVFIKENVVPEVKEFPPKLRSELIKLKFSSGDIFSDKVVNERMSEKSIVMFFWIESPKLTSTMLFLPKNDIN